MNMTIIYCACLFSLTAVLSGHTTSSVAQVDSTSNIDISAGKCI